MEDCNVDERNEGASVIDDHFLRHCRDGADSFAAEEEEEASKRRKVINDDNGVVLGLESLGVSNSSPEKRSSAADSETRSLEESSSSSCCSSNESSDAVKDGLKLADLKVKSNFESETADSTSVNNNNNTNSKFSRETTPSSELCADSEEITELASPTEKKYPPREEIEEFFAEAEKLDQKRFAEKYNYDIVKDLPLEGRYQWVSLKP